MDEQAENLPVLSDAPEARVIERPQETTTLAAPATVAAGGVLAGLATFALARILRNGIHRKSSVRIGGRRGAKLDIAASRSFLVDVHVLNNRR
jgi:hypothetical protein